MPGPPPFKSPVNHEAEEEPNGAPADVVDGPGGRHSAGATEDDGDVDESEETVARKGPREEVEGERSEEADEEEVVHGGVVTKAAEHAEWAHHAPDYGGVVEDVVAGACPRASHREFRGLADVGY